MKIKNFIFFIVIFAIFFNQTFAGIFFSEIFPNTVDDKNLEYVELYNSGESEFSLSGVILSDKIGKEYTFSESEILLPLEKKKYLRTLTKIILNNSSEELYLKDNSGNLLDSFSYSTSVKGEAIIVGENTSEEKPEEELEEETSTGELDEVENINVPEVIFNFQNRTYLLDKEKVLDAYYCDSSKEECKINLDFRNSFTGSFSENDFECETDFGFTNDQENRCNPATIIVPEGTYDFKIKIISKESQTNYSEKSFKIINDGYTKPVSKTSTIIATSITSTSSSKTPNHPIDPVIISKPEIIIQSGLNDENICINRNNCNLNLKYIEKSKFEKCRWNFDGGISDPGHNGKCDPGYVKYGTGEFVVNLRVYEKGDYTNFAESQFIFGNGVVPKQSYSNSNLKGDLINGIKIYGAMPNPEGSDNFEYIELINNTDQNYNLKGCVLDDILDGGSKQFTFKNDEILKPGEVKKYLKEITKLNLNNDEDEVNLYCNSELIDVLKRDFDIKSGYYLDHGKLDVASGKAKVVDVIDGDTIKIKFLGSDKIENFRLVGVDTPETKHPNKEVEQYGIEAYEFVLDNLKEKEIYIELDSENIRDTYSRLLGFVYLEGENFNKKIIENGFSKAYLDYDFKYEQDFLKAEEIAKANEIGIWSSAIEKTEIIKNEIEKELKSKIIVQGKIGKNKSLIGNKLICYDTCSVNFDGSGSSGNIKKYSWDFGNGEKFEGANPGYIKYENYGDYKVYLATLTDSGELDIEEFYVTYTTTPKKQKASIIPNANADNEIIETEFEESELINEIENDDSNYSLMLYIIITVFGILISVVILKKEDLI